MAVASRNIRIAQVIVVVNGVFNILVGGALLFAPRWFFDNIGNFPPFNRHYEGDLGAFVLALGVGLLVASRDPRRHWLIIAASALGGLLHVINHVYDSLIEQAPAVHYLQDVVPLFVFALSLGLALWLARPRPA